LDKEKQKKKGTFYILRWLCQ